MDDERDDDEDGDNDFGDFLRLAMESFGIDVDAWLEDQDRLEAEAKAKAQPTEGTA